MTNNLLKLINERAEKYALKYEYGSLDWTIAKVGHTDGATSMLSVIEDVAVKFYRWYLANPRMCDTTKEAYEIFITNIYKPTT